MDDTMPENVLVVYVLRELIVDELLVRYNFPTRCLVYTIYTRKVRLVAVDSF